MKLDACLAVGLDHLVVHNKTKGTCEGALCEVERLRNKHRRRTVVVVRIVEPVRVELDLAVVEVEVRGVIEANIGIRIFVFVHPSHQSLKVFLVGNKVRSCS